jgi:hypothetical protein
MSIQAVRVSGAWKWLGTGGVPAGGFPNAATTGFSAWPGYTGSLTPSHKDRYRAADSGTIGNPVIISGLQWGTDVGSVRIDSTAHDIIFRGCEVVGWNANLGGFHIETGAQRISFEYCTIHAAAPTDNTLASYTNTRLQYGICSNATNTVVDHCNIYWCPNTLQINETGTIVTNNYVHDMTAWDPGQGPGGFAGDHVDCFQMNAGTNNVTITGNTFDLTRHNGSYMDQTSPLALFQDFAPATGYTNVLIDGNLLAGPVGGGAWIYAGHEPAKSGVAGSNVVVSNNRFWDKPFASGGAPRSGFSIRAANQAWGSAGNAWTNNTWYDGPNAGAPAP